MKIIVTGGSGFVGSHTLKALRAAGHNTLNYDLVQGLDIRNYDQLLTAINPGDKILHLAAIARFAQCDEDPREAWNTNVGGTANVARAALEHEAERVVHASTASVYMPVIHAPIRENHPIGGNSQYGCSKSVAESMYRYYPVDHVILRYAHLYGEGKIGHGAIGGFIDRMNRGLAPVLFGGMQSNDFTYIPDIVAANLLALDTEGINEAYNIGTGEELTTERAFEIMREVFGYDEQFEYQPVRGVDPPRMVLDIDKARRIGFDPQWGFREGLQDLMELGAVGR